MALVGLVVSFIRARLHLDAVILGKRSACHWELLDCSLVAFSISLILSSSTLIFSMIESAFLRISDKDAG